VDIKQANCSAVAPASPPAAEATTINIHTHH